MKNVFCGAEESNVNQHHLKEEMEDRGRERFTLKDVPLLQLFYRRSLTEAPEDKKHHFKRLIGINLKEIFHPGKLGFYNKFEVFHHRSGWRASHSTMDYTDPYTR